MDRVGETQAIFRWAGGDLKKRRLLGAPVSAGRIEPKVAISLRGCDSTAWRPLQKSVLHKEWLIDFFERPYIFSNRRGNSADADRPAVELLYDGLEDPRVHVVEPELIDLEQLQRIGGDFAIDRAAGAHLREVTDASQQTIGHARSAA